MKTTFLKSALILGTACAMAFTVSQAKPAPQSTAKAATPDHHHDHTSKPAPHGQAYMKPGAALSFSHDMKAAIEPGDSGSFTLTIQDAYAAGQLEIKAIGDKGLRLYAASSGARFDLAGDTHTMNVHFDSSTAGRHYVSFQASVTTDTGQVTRRAYAVPVVVGDPATFVSKNKGQILVDDPAIGGKIIEMSIKETIDGVEQR
ncbi:MAG: hypothetical protein ACPGVT_08410 [Maricaulaceae bacterium]